MGLLQEYDNNENIIGDEDGAMKTKNLNATNIAKAKFQEKVAKNTNEETFVLEVVLLTCDICFIFSLVSAFCTSFVNYVSFLLHSLYFRYYHSSLNNGSLPTPTLTPASQDTGNKVPSTQ